MAKNFATIYNNTGDSIALAKSIYLKEETSPGSLLAPQPADFLYTLGGGGIEFSQPFESSPHASDRHNTDTIKKKKEMSWSISTYFNIDQALGSPAAAEIDTPLRLLFKSCLGYEDTTSGAYYDSRTPPSYLFSMFEVGDKWARQGVASFVNAATLSFPGNGEATAEWSGMGKESFLIGIGKSTTNNTANTVTVQTGEGKRFRVGGLVMLIKTNGTTRSTDTASNSSRTITAISGDVVTLSGAVLTDADGSGVSLPIYLCYYEPATKTGINNPVTGLVGSMSIVGLTKSCFRSATITLTNDHELRNDCFGFDSLAAPFFVASSRLNVELSVEMNLDHKVVEFYNSVVDFEAKDFQLVLGSGSGRRMQIDIPKAIFPVPQFAVPENGSIPITFTGLAYQTALDAADEISISFL